MLASTRTVSALTGVALCTLAAAFTTVAAAAPIVVNLRVEGANRTLFEGPVSTEAILAPPGIETASSEGSHPCDVKDNGDNGGFGAAAATPTAALYDAATAQHLPFDASWSTEFNDFDINQVGEDIANSDKNGEYWGYAVNFTTAELGGCQIRLAPGSEVLWAYNFFGLPHLLSLTGPAGVNAGTPFTVHVTDGQTGQPIAGAAIGQLVAGLTTTSASSPTTDGSGNATVTLAQTGTETLKATQAESVRSNGLTVCVHNGNDGTCGTNTPTPVSTVTVLPSIPIKAVPEVVRVTGVTSGRRYSHRSAPRILGGSVEVPAGETLHEVRLSLERSSGHRCYAFDGRSAAFTHAKCHTSHFFKVADTTSFSYLLPSRLPAGHYVYEIEAVSNGGGVTQLADGVSRVVFYVK
jgi:hypothetical protein